MSLQDKIDEFQEDSAFFTSSISLNYNSKSNILIVNYPSLFGLYDIYDIKEGINQRDEENHVKYKYEKNILTILVDKNYRWSSATTSSTDILRLPNSVRDVEIEFF